MRLRQNQTARPLSGCIANASRYQIPLPEKPGTRPAPAEPTIFEPLCTCERVCVGGGSIAPRGQARLLIVCRDWETACVKTQQPVGAAVTREHAVIYNSLPE